MKRMGSSNFQHAQDSPGLELQLRRLELGEKSTCTIKLRKEQGGNLLLPEVQHSTDAFQESWLWFGATGQPR